MKRLQVTAAQIRALKYLVKHPAGVWVSGTPVTQKCLNVLHDKGLVDVCYDLQRGYLEKLTDAGREAAAQATP